MRFLKLLDPRGVTPFGPGPTIAEQARCAIERFPPLVEESLLTYWRPGDPVQNCGSRFLIGLAPSFSLLDLRFADILNESLSINQHIKTRIDLFAVEDIKDLNSIQLYYPGLEHIPTTPVVGYWLDGLLQTIRFGGNAINFVFMYIDVNESAKELAKSVHPPSWTGLNGIKNPQKSTE